MKLNDAKAQFFRLRDQDRIDVAEEHVIEFHSSRGYSVDEVLSLVKNRSGKFEDTTDHQFKGERFYWRTKDIESRSVRIVIEFDTDELGQLILVVSAGERR